MKYNIFFGDWGLGIGDWGLGIGDWAQSPIPISLKLNYFLYLLYFYLYFMNIFI
jgi:hypothetical protein